MCPEVTLEVVFEGELVIAVRARPRFLPGVRAHVAVQVVPSTRHVRAVLALEHLPARAASRHRGPARDAAAAVAEHASLAALRHLSEIGRVKTTRKPGLIGYLKSSAAPTAKAVNKKQQLICILMACVDVMSEYATCNCMGI